MNNNTTRVWILGAPDPEMEMIETLLRDCGEEIIYALDADGERVHPGNAYRCPTPEIPDGATVYAVECVDTLPEGWVRVDHHRPGDPGYGRPPEDFMSASSIGQVLSILRGHGPAFFDVSDGGEWITCDGGEHRDVGGFVIGMPYADTVPHEMVLAAAADHCLGAAYRGECPGVDPDALMRWRAESRARFQGRDVSEVMADIERAQEALRAAPELVLSEHQCEWHARGAGGDCNNASGTDWADDPCSAVVVRDMRRPVDERPVRELPEAAARLGIGYVSGPLVGPDGRRKITCSGTAEQVGAFLDHWAPEQGLTGIYGDPHRGFAGGYLSEISDEESGQ